MGVVGRGVIHRQVVNGALWRLPTGAPWRDLSERYGPWQTVCSYAPVDTPQGAPCTPRTAVCQLGRS